MFHFSNFAKFSLLLIRVILNKALSCLRNLCRQTTNERKRKKERLGSSFCIFLGTLIFMCEHFLKEEEEDISESNKFSFKF